MIISTRAVQFRVACVTLFTVLVGVPGLISARDLDHTEDSRAVNDYWTPERLKAAVPPTITLNIKPRFTLHIKPRSRRFIQTRVCEDARSTNSRVFPDSAIAEYPYSTTGKLFFVDPQDEPDHQDKQCSAAVFNRRLVVTAGHCVQHPDKRKSKQYFFEKFEFIPAYGVGVNKAPLEKWYVEDKFVASDWSSSDGKVPNGQDVAILVMKDQEIEGKPKSIADVTGKLNFATNRLEDNHLTILGYPGKLDGGERMQITNAQMYKSLEKNTYLYGSNMSEGASGGPWIEHFGIDPKVIGQNTMVRNLLVGVSSAATPNRKCVAASNLNEGFMKIVRKACAKKSGNC
jgi:V8-like Glu-specific endopeptidase